MSRTFKVILLTVALAAFVFNVLSPDTPTPSGMVKDQSDTPTLYLHTFSSQSVFEKSLLSQLSASTRVLPADSIVELTCARLC